MKNLFSIPKFFGIIAFCAGTITAIAQSNKDEFNKTLEIKSYNNETHLPNLFFLPTTQRVQSNSFNSWMNSTFRLHPDLSFRSLRTETDELGMKHERFQQLYNQIPIEGAIVVVHSKNNEIVSVNGEFVKQMNAPTKSVLSESQALQKALKKVKAKKYKWENKEDEQFMRKAFENPSFSYFPNGDLFIVHKKNSDYSATNFCLAYRFNIYAEEPLYRAYVFVDASTGEVLDEQNLICTADVTGTAATLYSGQQTITMDNSISGQYRLRETGRGKGIETYNCNGAKSYTTTDFKNTSTTWTGTGTNQAATDAHWGAESTYDYFKQKFNRNSIDDNGYKLLSYVHYDVNYANAFWDGQRMTYGDGSASKGFNVMTGLDVCGHEITHGLVSNTASLGNGEAGALNEGFADIFGTTIEKFARPNQNDWLMGPELMTNGKGIRNMADPNSLKQPDTYKGTYWDAAGEVHINDGPCIYWYYLMCMGGSGTNDLNNTYNITAIGIEDAAKIAYRALTKYFTSSTNYTTARTYSIQAATDLFGSCSPQTIACTNAWYAVGVGAQYVASPVAASFLSAQTSSCTLPATINFNNTTANGSSYVWDFGDGGSSNLANPTHTYTQAGTYTVKLTATGCTNTQDVVVKNAYININPPSAPTVTGGTNCGPGSVILYANGTGTLTWYDAQGNQVATGTSFTTPVISATTTYSVSSSSVTTPTNGGPATNTVLGTGGYLTSTHYLVFDVTDASTIQTVDIYAQSAGNRKIDLQDNTGAVLQTKTINAIVGKNTVTLNFHLNAGTGYRLVASGTTIDLYRNNAGATYPISIGSVISITGTDVTATNPTYYYYFYNWMVQKDPCTSAAVPVVAIIDPCISVKELTLQNIDVYPNPANNLIVIKNNKEIFNINLFDQTGRLVAQSKTQGDDFYQLDLSLYSNGVYYLQLSNNTEVVGKRIVIQK